MRKWTIEEIKYLEDKFGVVLTRTIAIKINRTENAVYLKARKLGLDTYYGAIGSISAAEVSHMLGIDGHTIINHWIPQYGLKAKQQEKNFKFQILLNDLVKWLKNNQDKWNSRKLDLYALGQEPQWLKEKRNLDLVIPKKSFKPWTKADDNLLIFYYKQGKKQKEIAKILGRSSNGVNRRISRLQERRLLYKPNVRCKWTEKEEKLFKELESLKLSDEQIALELGREAYHIKDHRRNLRNKGFYEGRKKRCAGL